MRKPHWVRFLLGLPESQSKEFVIETHSDYILDRVRRAVADGIIKPEAVAFYYLEKEDGKTTEHLIDLGEQEFDQCTPSYRRFFLDEEMRILPRA